MPAYKDRNGTWFVKFQYRDNGKPKTKLKRGFEKKRDALEFERKFLEYYAPSVDMTFDTLIQRFMETKEGELRPNTLRGYRVVAECRYIDSIRHKKLSEITPADILNVRAEMKGLKGSTVNLYLTRLTSVFGFAVDMYDLKKNPCSGIGTVRTDAKEMRFLTIEDVERLKSLDMTEETLVLTDVLFWTGMRISEALALTVGDIRDTYISVFKHKIRANGGWVVQRGTKNNKGRNVPIFPALASELKDYIGKMYDSSPGMQLFPRHYMSYFERYQRLFRLAEIEGATPHTFRHSHVALLIHMGYSPKIIADRIGDKVETMLSVYAHVYAEDVENMMTELENVSNLYHKGS